MTLRAEYEQHGAVVVRQVLNPEEVSMVTAAIEANLNDLSPRAKRASTDDDGSFIEDFCSWQRVSEVEQVVRLPALSQLAAELMGSQQVRFFHDHMLVKEPGTSQRTPWHHDIPYYNVEGRQNVSMWIPVDPVPRAVSLEFLAGSHHGPWYMPRTFLDEQAKWFPEGSLSELPVIEGDDPRVIGWELDPGDVVCFHMQTLHTAAGNPGPHRRRVLTLRFLGDDMVHAPRQWATSPEFPGLASRLPAGAEMNDPLFPRL